MTTSNSPIPIYQHILYSGHSLQFFVVPTMVAVESFHCIYMSFSNETG